MAGMEKPELEHVHTDRCSEEAALDRDKTIKTCCSGLK